MLSILEIQTLAEEQLPAALGKMQIGLHDDLLSQGLDSMALIRLVIAIEEKLGKEFPAELVSLENFKTIAVIAKTVSRTASGFTPGQHGI